jgi:hypothetical protein
MSLIYTIIIPLFFFFNVGLLFIIYYTKGNTNIHHVPVCEVPTGGYGRKEKVKWNAIKNDLQAHESYFHNLAR